MYCQSCGNKISDSAKFCGNCGAEVNVEFIPQTEVIEKHSKGRVAKQISEKNLCSILGIVFLISGALPYIWSPDLLEYVEYVNSHLTSFGIEAVMGISILRGFIIGGNYIFYFSSSFVAILTGIILLKKREYAGELLVTNIVFQIISVAYTGIIKILVYSMPELVMSTLTSDSSFIEAGVQLLKEKPDILYYYQGVATQRFVISVVLIVISLAVMFANANPKRKKTISIAGAIVMLPILALISRISYYIMVKIITPYGSNEVSSYSITYTLLHYKAKDTREIFLVCIVYGVIIAFMFEKMKYWKKVLYGIGVMVLTGILLQIFAFNFVRGEMSAEYVSRALVYFRTQTCEAFLILSALFLWFCAVARGHIRVWIQIAIPILLLPVFLIFEMIGVALGVQYISIGWLGVVIVMILASILLAFPKKSSKIRRR